MPMTQQGYQEYKNLLRTIMEDKMGPIEDRPKKKILLYHCDQCPHCQELRDFRGQFCCYFCDIECHVIPSQIVAYEFPKWCRLGEEKCEK